ncbi:XisH family protein [Oscillatoriales cyanobacterium LEGE 11467]|uniref:XisH family protein n=1 Tax=Zarconia navalis LEGE 11467 TaxID=1828826 RepID=A0A928Z916_9CYAN|nr:XisH family protein [Zarconia navalis]MBE9042130.1 XisH family protein [Zarconia navalis LEGE 11467]
MPAKDLYHDRVRSALIKDGWRITRDTYQIKFKEIKLYADLAAETMFAAERDRKQIIVEVKSFLGASRVRDFEAAIGQYILYRLYLSQIFPEATVYLAINSDIYRSFFLKEAIEFVIKELNIQLIIVDIDREVIVRWINS